jgi:hypothetical protein
MAYYITDAVAASASAELRRLAPSLTGPPERAPAEMVCVRHGKVLDFINPCNLQATQGRGGIRLCTILC